MENGGRLYYTNRRSQCFPHSRGRTAGSSRSYSRSNREWSSHLSDDRDMLCQEEKVGSLAGHEQADSGAAPDQ